MDINKKLDIFYQAAMEAAEAKSEEMEQSERENCSRRLAEYENVRQQEQNRRFSLAEEKLRREMNRRTAAQLLELKKDYQDSREECRRELFALVEEKLTAYRNTEEYGRQLVRLAEKAKRFAGTAEFTIYVSPSDAGRAETLAAETGCTVNVSEEEFQGGIRAAIPAKNVLLDESFATKLAQEREEWSGWK